MRNSFFFSSSLFCNSLTLSLSLSLSLSHRTINTSSAQPLCLLLFPEFGSFFPIDTHPLRYRRCSSFPLNLSKLIGLGKTCNFDKVTSDRLCSVESQYDYVLQFLQTRDCSFSLESSQVECFQGTDPGVALVNLETGVQSWAFRCKRDEESV
ncbi:hypothetical protein LOK49_LG01G01813 [Camellia lanceoleosa]|uniref:Uncharacterized protein n=1 Tax=Camellia lanceoleosa TaxID=1840588 RepID=A0ACC0IW19_9ERIC|nr:hypothetical protein LOK49_LG01G01813 [Camellia lanceoleosa]